MSDAAPEIRWTVVQLGAFYNYSVPLGFEHQGHLRRFYTDIWTRLGKRLFRQGPTGIRALATRHHPQIPNSKVKSFSIGTITKRLTAKTSITREEIYLDYMRFGEWFGTKVCRDLMKQSWDRSCDVFLPFNTVALESIRAMKQLGIMSVVHQIDAGRTEDDMVQEELMRFRGWAAIPGRIPDAYFARLQAEWAEADLLAVSSPWSKAAMIQQGVPAEKIIVSPAIFEVTAPVPVKARHDRPLKVLWLGQVIVRKGIQYVLTAARALPAIEFNIVGSVGISAQAVSEFPSNVKFLGRISRDMTAEMYRQADVFILPTISDGFAITQLEAMAQGLPVVTTPNCGEVVTDGVDGLIVPIRDGEALGQAIAKLDADRGLLEAMSAATANKIAKFRSQAVINRLEADVARVMSMRR